MGTVPLGLLASERCPYFRLSFLDMSVTAPSPDGSKVTALLQLLRGRSYEEIRARMYDNSLGTPWWSACKTELDIRNSERLPPPPAEKYPGRATTTN